MVSKQEKETLLRRINTHSQTSSVAHTFTAMMVPMHPQEWRLVT